MGRTSGGQPTDHHQSQPGLCSYVSSLPDTPCAGAKWCMWSLWGKGVPSITRATPKLKANQANSAVSPRRLLTCAGTADVTKHRSKQEQGICLPCFSSTLASHLPPKGVNCTKETVVNKMQVTLVITGSFGQVIRAQCFPASPHTQGTKSLLSQFRGFTAWDIKHMRGWGRMNVLDKEKNWL